jgi:molybdate transport repressor ModE-like protein
MRIEPSISLLINGRAVTARQLEVLVAIEEEGSQNRAAERMGISTPVLHRYLGQLEERSEVPLTTTSSRGTRLTREGRAVVEEFMALKGRTRSDESVIVGCTIITEELLLDVLSRIDRGGEYDLIISDDDRNLADFRAGLMDLVVLDDPLHAYECEDAIWEEIADDHLVHVARGERYMRFMYGAQRIGFRHLESEGIPFMVSGTTRSLSAMDRSGLSYFVNHSYAVRKGLRIRSSTPEHMLRHKILAMWSHDSTGIQRLVGEMRRKRL